MKSRFLVLLLLPLCSGAPLVGEHDHVGDDQDGHAQEHEGEWMERLRLMFETIDLNRDGLMDAKELIDVSLENNIDIEETVTLPDKTAGLTMDMFIEMLAHQTDLLNRQGRLGLPFQQWKRRVLQTVLKPFNSRTGAPGGFAGVHKEGSAGVQKPKSGTKVKEGSAGVQKPNSAIDGGWTVWSWSGCSKTCGVGQKLRSRTCTNPPPSFGGRYCPGQSEEVQNCVEVKNCPVDGGWSNWSKYEKCSKNCGGGQQTRKRTCTNPVPQHKGRTCVGDPTETKDCNLHPCAIDGGWTVWSYWRGCSKTCGVGQKSRSRTCTNPPPSFGGEYCPGQSEEVQNCVEVKNCPVDGGWSNWSKYEKCSKTCGGGQQTRKRTCTNPVPQHKGRTCVGDPTETKDCNLHPCAIDGGWTRWKRTCTNPSPQHGGKPCAGPASCNKNIDCAKQGGESCGFITPTYSAGDCAEGLTCERNGIPGAPGICTRPGCGSKPTPVCGDGRIYGSMREAVDAGVCTEICTAYNLTYPQIYGSSTTACQCYGEPTK